MKIYVLDANAVVRYFQMGPAGGGDKVRGAVLELAQKGQAKVFMSAVNLGEVHYVMLRHTSQEEVSRVIGTLRRVISIVEADAEQAIEAANLKHELAYADSCAAALALNLGAILVSVDSSFEKLGKQLK